MSKVYRISYSPHPSDDEDLPWEYQEDAFVTWVDEVFFEGYKKKKDAPFRSADECVSHLNDLGYCVEILEE